MNSLKQKAAPWVSLTVLAGGVVTTGILFFLVRVEAQADTFSSSEIKVEELGLNAR